MSKQHAEIKLTVPAETLQRLQAVATEQNMALDDVLRQALEAYLDDDDEPTEAEILESIRIGMKQALAGDYRPAHEVLDEIERETADDADGS